MRHHKQARQIKQLRYEGVIKPKSLITDRRKKTKRKKKPDPNKKKHIPTKAEYCELCDLVAFLTKHHLIPKSEIKKKRFAILKKPTPTAWLCKPCHTQIHIFFDNRTLADKFNTVEKLKRNPKVNDYLLWHINRYMSKHPESIRG